MPGQAGVELSPLTENYDANVGIIPQVSQRRGDNNRRPRIPSHRIDGQGQSRHGSVVVAGLYDFLPPIKAIGRDVVTPMFFTADIVGRQRCIVAQRVVGAAHTTF